MQHKIGHKAYLHGNSSPSETSWAKHDNGVVAKI